LPSTEKLLSQKNIFKTIIKIMKRLIFFFIIFSFGKNLISSIQELDIIYNSTNTFKNPLFYEKK